MQGQDDAIWWSEELKKHKEFFWNHPEEGFAEYCTAQYIAKELTSYGYEVSTGVAGTGVMAILLKENIQCILFRAEMDAISIEDSHGQKKQSHLCGHDAHMAMLLVLARYVKMNEESIHCSIKFVFQPAEETLGGAKAMLKAGILQNPIVTRAFGLHMWSEFQVGEIAIDEGPVMAGGDELYLDVYGKSGHGAMPHATVDSILLAASVVNGLQSIISRNVNPLDSAVVSIGTVHGGNSKNTIAEVTKLTGTCRYYTKSTQKILKKRIHNLCNQLGEAYGGKVNIAYVEKHPPVVNSKKEVQIIEALAGEIGAAVIKKYKSMCVEDFSYYLDKVPGCFIFIGCRDGVYHPQHSLQYSVAEKSMVMGLCLLIKVVHYYSKDDR